MVSANMHSKDDAGSGWCYAKGAAKRRSARPAKLAASAQRLPCNAAIRRQVGPRTVRARNFE
jgi:hypothetical protein